MRGRMVIKGKPVGRNAQQERVILWSFLVLVELAAWSHAAVGQTLSTESEVRDSLSAESMRELLLLNVDEEDVAQQERIMDLIWSLKPAFQTAWSWRSEETKPTHLGSAHQWQARIAARGNTWQLGIILDKDRGEPWGRGPVPWTGPELKRWYAAVQTDRFHAIAGSFRIQHGFGLVSGRRQSWFPARSNPLGLPRRIATSSGYAGSTAGPLRSGFLGGVASNRAALRVWYSLDNVASRLGKAGPDAQVAILDVSSTGAFMTASSIERRNRVRIAATGLQAALAGRRWQSSLLVEHLQSAHQPALEMHFLNSLPFSVFAASVAGRWTPGPFTLISEQSMVNGQPLSGQIGIRWRHSSGSGIVLHHARIHGGLSSPYGTQGRYRAEYKNDSRIQVALTWRLQRGSRWTLRFARKNLFRDDGIYRSQRWAVDWERTGKPLNRSGAQFLFGHTLLTDGGPSDPHRSTYRAYTRWRFAPFPPWQSMVQLQFGKRWSRQDVTSKSLMTGLTLTRLSDIASLPDWSMLLLVRRSWERGVVLYALQPVSQGGYPVLSGSSSMKSLIQQLRWNLSTRTQGELIFRMDGGLKGSVTPRVRLSFRVRIAL